VHWAQIKRIKQGPGTCYSSFGSIKPLVHTNEFMYMKYEWIRPSLSGKKRQATLFDRFSCQTLTQRNLQGVQFIFDVLLTFGLKKDSHLTFCCLLRSNADIKWNGRDQWYSVVHPACCHWATRNLTTVPTGTHPNKEHLIVNICRIKMLQWSLLL